MKKYVIAGTFALALTGCASLQKADVAVGNDICKNEATFVAGALALNDTKAIAAVEAFCGTPVSVPVVTPSVAPSPATSTGA